MALEEASLQNGKEKKVQKKGQSEHPVEKGLHEVEVESLTASGHRALMSSHNRKALSCFRKALALSLDMDDLSVRQTCTFNLGAAYVQAGKPGKGLPLLLEARTMTNDPSGDLFFNIGAAQQGLGHFGQALEAFREAQDHYRRIRAQSEAGAGVKMGQCLAAMGDETPAARCFLEAAKAVSVAGGPEEDVAAALGEAVRLVLRGSSHEDSDVAAVLHEGRQLCEGMRNKALQGKLHLTMGLGFSQLRIFSLAAESFEKALSFLQTEEEGASEGARALEASALQNLGAAHNALQRYHSALGLHRKAAALHSELGERGGQGQCFANLGQALSALGAHKEAEESYLHALQAFRDAGDLRGQRRCWEGLGATHLLLGDPQRAANAYQQALALLSKTQDASEAVQERIVGQLTEALQAKLLMDASGHIVPTDPQHCSPMIPSLARLAASPSLSSLPQQNKKGFPPIAYHGSQGCPWLAQWSQKDNGVRRTHQCRHASRASGPNGILNGEAVPANEGTLGRSPWRDRLPRWPLQWRPVAQDSGLKPHYCGHRASAQGPNGVPNGEAILANEGRSPRKDRSWREGLRSVVCAVM
ncbi:tetratricopeptide repeat protein 24 isoform X2 [Anolis carolinensis]